MTQYLFISDLHLCDERPTTVDLFLKFLQTTATHADKLYILGDLFDAWVGDDDDSQTAAAVAEGLKQLNMAGTAIYIMHGNRDFLIGDRFCQACHANLLDDPTIINIADKAILLTHGDQLCTKDLAYQQARQVRIQPAWLKQLLQKSLAERKAIAEQYRQQSGESKSLLAKDIMDVTPEEVEHWFENYNVDIMIHGHTHRPARHQHQIKGVQKTRIVLPEWHADKASALAIDDNMTISLLEI